VSPILVPIQSHFVSLVEVWVQYNAHSYVKPHIEPNINIGAAGWRGSAGGSGKPSLDCDRLWVVSGRVSGDDSQIHQQIPVLNEPFLHVSKRGPVMSFPVGPGFVLTLACL